MLILWEILLYNECKDFSMRLTLNYRLNITIISLCFFGLTHIVNGQENAKLSEKAKNDYTVEQLQSLEPYKVEYLNWYYESSYIFKENLKCVDCPVFDKNKFIVSKYEHLRKNDERNRINITKPGHYIILLSYVELKNKKTEINKKSTYFCPDKVSDLKYGLE